MRKECFHVDSASSLWSLALEGEKNTGLLMGAGGTSVASREMGLSVYGLRYSWPVAHRVGLRERLLAADGLCAVPSPLVQEEAVAPSVTAADVLAVAIGTAELRLSLSNGFNDGSSVGGPPACARAGRWVVSPKGKPTVNTYKRTC